MTHAGFVLIYFFLSWCCSVVLDCTSFALFVLVSTLVRMTNLNGTPGRAGGVRKTYKKSFTFLHKLSHRGCGGDRVKNKKSGQRYTKLFSLYFFFKHSFILGKVKTMRAGYLSQACYKKLLCFFEDWQPCLKVPVVYFSGVRFQM